MPATKVSSILAARNTQLNPENRIRKRRMNIPYWRRAILNRAKRSGKTEKRIHEPSSGGTGIRLNIPRTKLYKTIIAKADSMVSDNGKNLMARPKIMATKKFAAGPARETFASPHL